MPNEATLSDDLLHLGQIYNFKKLPIPMNIKYKISYCSRPQTTFYFMLDLYSILLSSIKNYIFDLYDKQISDEKNYKSY